MAEHEHVHGHSADFGAQATGHAHEHGHGPGQVPGHMHTHEHDHEHEEAAPEKGAQKVTVEDVGPARKCLTIEVPPERIAKKLETGFEKLADDAVLPGFRKGRAPMRLIEKRFGTSMRDDTRAQLLSECYHQAIEELKLDVLGEPEVKDLDKIKLPDSGSLVFKVEVEVSPTFELPELTGIEVQRPAVEVNDQAVGTEMERLREHFAVAVAVTDAAVQADDHLTCDVRILKGTNASPVASGDDELMHLPETPVLVTGEKRGYKGVIAGLIVEDAGRLLAGKRIGDIINVSMTGPKGHENERIRDQAVTLIARIDKIERFTPAATETLPERLGVASLDELKQRIRLMIEERAKAEQQDALRRQVCDYLMEKVKMDLPAGLSGRQAARLLQRQAMEMAYRGVPEEKIEEQIAELRTVSEEQARTQLKLFFLLDQAAKKLGIEVSEAEVNGTIASLAVQRGRRPEKLRQEMQRNGQLEQVYLQVRENKTLEKILESAKIVDQGAAAAPAAAAAPSST